MIFENMDYPKKYTSWDQQKKQVVLICFKISDFPSLQKISLKKNTCWCNNIYWTFPQCLVVSFVSNNVSRNKEKEIICLGNVKCESNISVFGNKFSTWNGFSLEQSRKNCGASAFQVYYLFIYLFFKIKNKL